MQQQKQEKQIIECPGCGRLYTIDNHSLKPTTVFHCKRCRTKFTNISDTPIKTGSQVARRTQTTHIIDEDQIVAWLGRPRED